MPRGKPFVSGQPKPEGSGRKKGTLNRTSRAVKEFLAELVDDPEIQAALRTRIKKGDAATFFRALEHVIGRPRATVEVSTPDNLAERILAGRKRLAEYARAEEARRGTEARKDT